MMKKYRRIALLFLFLLPAGYQSHAQELSSKIVKTYFNEIRSDARHYRGLWNKNLYGPVLLVDPKTRMIYSNYPDSAGVLTRTGSIYTGILPLKINVANTATSWNGIRWAMIMMPLPEDRHERADLILHELFHRSQPELGFTMNNPSNDHLDKRDGRILLRLELEALKQAFMASSITEMKSSLNHALYFRKLRHSTFPGSAKEENSLELNEGMAAYTGIFMSGRSGDQLKEYFIGKLNDFRSNPTFVRSFAYLTIPLYGTLLSKFNKHWTREIINTTDLTDFFIRSFNADIPDKIDTAVMEKYHFSLISAEENKREEQRERMISEYTSKYVDLPHLEIRLEKMSISFDPRNLMPLEDYGTVYPSLRISDNWGILNVTAGALLGKNWDKVSVSVPTVFDNNKVSGDGWTLELNDGYRVEKNASGQNYLLVNSRR